MDLNIVLMKLAISMFALSEITYTWKYLLYKYGHHQAVKRFLNLILWFDTPITHVNDVDSLIEQTELTLILDDIDQIIERNS